MKIKAKSDSENIRIYFNNILHLRIPRDENILLQSWIKTNTKLFYIELILPSNSFKIEYEDENIWKEVLNLLDKHI
jgi:hypothetical protein